MNQRLRDKAAAGREKAKAAIKRGKKLFLRRGNPTQARRVFYYDPSRYQGKDLRRLNAERGVGRPPHIIAKRRQALLEKEQTHVRKS